MLKKNLEFKILFCHLLINNTTLNFSSQGKSFVLLMKVIYITEILTQIFIKIKLVHLWVTFIYLT